MVLSASLKPANKSQTLKVTKELLNKMDEINPIVVEIIHLVDYRIPPGTAERVSPSDDWPSIADKIRASDIIIFATPIWWNSRSSIMQRAIERMDSFTDAGGFPGRGGLGKMVGKVAGIVITGGEDGGQSVQAHLMEPLTWFGFALPPLCTYFELGGDERLREQGLSTTAGSLVKAALAVRPAPIKPEDSVIEISLTLAEDKELRYNKHGRPVNDNPKDKLYVVSSDTDGVLANWVKGYLKVFNSKYGTHITESQWRDEPFKGPDPLMTKAQFEEAFDDMLKIPEFYLSLDPYKNVDFDAINQDLKNSLYNFYVVTVRVNLTADQGITDTTQLLSRWIHKVGVPLVTGCNAGAEDRPKLLEQLGVDYHLDDYIKQVEAINKHGKTKAYLMDRPWNKQYDVGDLRVKSFDEFLMKTIWSKSVEAKQT